MQGQLFGDNIDTGASLLILERNARRCFRCGLHAGRENVVFGEGHVNEPPIAFVGEGPGHYEDKSGRPFVGPSGRLLDRMISAMGLERSSVYITNVVCCRPPHNRKPTPSEINSCKKYLIGQLEATCPRVIVTLGSTAAQVLLGTTLGVKALRGECHVWRKRPLYATFHPAYLLRAGIVAKAAAWEDLKTVMARLGLEVPAGK